MLSRRSMLLAPAAAAAHRAHAAPAPLPFTVKLETLNKQEDPAWQWFHPRPVWVPGYGAMITVQKHLMTSDHYSGLFTMTSRDFGRTWAGPREIPELAWRRDGDVDIAVADVTPGYLHGAQRVLAVGAQVRYSRAGKQLEDRPKAHQTAYALMDPKSGAWSPWQTLAMPDEPRFNFARSACAQWLELRDGTVLLPMYYGPNARDPWSVTVARFRLVDGRRLEFIGHGSEHKLAEVRGLVEPSLACYNGRYFLTVRNDLRGYVAAGADGLDFHELKPWRFDDGAELGSYNTQQHWLSHSDGLFLSYTRRGANNDHVTRHRAPLFLAQVDPASLRVIRSTERVLMPEHGAMYGNFGAAAMSKDESWVTDVEGMFGPEPRKRGAEGRMYLARVLWARPNRDWDRLG